MPRAILMMTEQRQRDVEVLAQSMLSQTVNITPHGLAERANVNWFLARDILQGLVRKGLLKALPSGEFSRVAGAKSSAVDKAGRTSRLPD